MSYGITDRLEFDGVALRYSLLEDAPLEGDGRAPDGFGLTLGAGLGALGYSKEEGAIVAPALLFQSRARWLPLAVTLSAIGGPFITTRDGRATVFCDAGLTGTVQVSDIWAVSLGPDASYRPVIGDDADGARTSRLIVGADVGLHFDPVEWFGVQVGAGAKYYTRDEAGWGPSAKLLASFAW